MSGKYTIKDLRKDFPNDDRCLDYIFHVKHPGKNKYTRITGRKGYQNPQGHQIYPLKGTIFEKSDTPLTLWFHTLFLFSVSKNGVAAKEIQRQLGVTYKCAWRMCYKIRTLMQEDGIPLSGIVEADETYVGGRGRKTGRGTDKTAVFGIVERGGRIKTALPEDVSGRTLSRLVVERVDDDVTMMTDDWQGYKWLKRRYPHHIVRHGQKQYVKGEAHTNTIEGFWSQFKSSVRGTHHSISKQHLQNYLNEFTWRYSNRFSN